MTYIRPALHYQLSNSQEGVRLTFTNLKNTATYEDIMDAFMGWGCPEKSSEKYTKILLEDNVISVDVMTNVALDSQLYTYLGEIGILTEYEKDVPENNDNHILLKKYENRKIMIDNIIETIQNSCYKMNF